MDKQIIIRSLRQLIRACEITEEELFPTIETKSVVKDKPKKEKGLVNDYYKDDDDYEVKYDKDFMKGFLARYPDSSINIKSTINESTYTVDTPETTTETDNNTINPLNGINLNVDDSLLDDIDDNFGV